MVLLAVPFFDVVHVRAESDTSRETSQAAKVGFPKKGVKFYNLLLGFTSWTERVSLTRGQTSDSALANLFGNTVMFELERYPVARWGYYLQGEALFGYANVGGSQAGIPYQLAGQPWFGTAVAARGGYRIIKEVAFTLGPIALYRQMDLPPATNISVRSGADFNFGATVDMRIRLATHWELRQEIGTLMVNATTFWSLGFGHKF